MLARARRGSQKTEEQEEDGEGGQGSALSIGNASGTEGMTRKSDLRKPSALNVASRKSSTMRANTIDDNTQSVLSGYGRSVLSGNQGSAQDECFDTKVTERSSESSDVDELKELEMRTGLVNNKVSKMRMPALKQSS